MNQAIRGHP